MKWHKDFYNNGYVIIDIDDLNGLDALRKDVVSYTKKIVDVRNTKSDEDFLNLFHLMEIPESDINEIRKKLVFDFSIEQELNRRIYEILKEPLRSLVGSDVLAQKTTNFSIQTPNEESIVPVHRDAPINSHFELVVWLPLVDAYGTKSMFLLDKELSKKALLNFKKDKNRFQDYSLEAKSGATHKAVKYGQVLLFQSNCAHGVEINTENETRWSLNVRFKNLFTPFGKKNALNFFDILDLSPLTRISIESETFENQLEES